MRGRPPKLPERRQGHRTAPSFALVRADEVPAPRTSWLKLTRERWATYWQSELAQATRAPHLQSVDRLFALYDERERAYRAVQRKGRVVEGSQGQTVAHPLLKYIAQCDGEIRQLEDRLGLSPRGMAQLGASFATAKKSLDDLNQQLDTDEDDNDGNADPRVEVVG